MSTPLTEGKGTAHSEPPATEPDIWSTYASAAADTSPVRAPSEGPDSEPAAAFAAPRSTLPLLALGAAIAVVLACVGLALAVRLSAGDDDAETGSVSGESRRSAAVPSIVPKPTSAAAVSTATTADSADVATTTPAVATAPTSSTAPAATTAGPAPTVQSSTTPAPPVSAPRSAPVTTSRSAAGASVLEDPLPSGMASAEFESSLVAAQRLADALASGDWIAARRLDPGLNTVSDEELQDGYGALDRATLLLVDARREGDHHRLLFILIANERAGAQTTLYCAQSTVSPTGVVQPQSASVVRRASGTVGLEALKGDVGVVDLIREQCTWE